MRLYLAGPMRGIPDFNFPAFEEAASLLRSVGHEVWSPAEQEQLTAVKTHGPENFAAYMERDLAAVCRSDAVAVLPDWQKSQGARLETYVATELGKPVKDFHEYLTCWCGMKLGQIVSGDRNVLECPSHGTAYHEDSEARMRRLVGSA